jgi:hypothetical protein
MDKDLEQYALLKDVNPGEFVKRKAELNKVYRKGEYDRSLKGYWLLDCDDISRAIIVKGTKPVYINFIY